ncbi:hypothetical protein H8R29_11680 [Priestia megaterium]|uniref:Uncharacterized protein n=1 Tax=Priestia megaterium (strain ATCC 14581 / DSM 32 / CCUG 1817 / JCM 2506 / NBRC 15308 / NCIMB 9376 / NCTC 10342 / NRRL B-14308 / VKM B-512 / Ford 19) TaxID=1348623 RepID=A0A0B6ARA5_PRIM2|nr:hypothetical protein [Priestia megaterium]AJI23677.1 hypothetical protein BG04_4624 [Priestia megaterium NBRC 15308 = ATCC 14581]KFM98061.1 hypothetical protein DJ91_645 [Priestia megaterium]KGJ73909.1 hypothetical protein BMT_05885 [Priestia megaterium NBRC 15308 = ATCC 14581]MDR4231374.1 hypothetical protein [Priestia megaterium]MED3807641.1 hypothetical protein [Priestia megaterium]
MAQVLSAQESSEFRALLITAINLNVEIVTAFGSITGEVVQTGSVIKIPLNYVVLKQAEKDFVYIPLASIHSVIIINKDGELS